MSESDEVTAGKGKTPISYLQEICTKKGVTPQYDLVANEGAVHEPLFVFKVIAGDIVGTGKGPSKKKAKHNAAISALSQLLDCGNVNHLASVISNLSSSDQPQNIKPQVLIDAGDNMDGNPVGDLQEAMQKKMWPTPIYEYTTEQGPPHAREFVCNVTLFNFTEQAVGKSKKLAKRNAAAVMLEKVKQGLVVPCENFVAVKNDDHNDQVKKVYGQQQNTDSTNNSTMTKSSTQTTNDNGLKQDSGEKRKTSSMFVTSKNTKLSKVIESLQGLNTSLEEKEGELNDESDELENRERDHMEVITVPINASHKNIYMSKLCNLAIEQKFLVTFHEAPRLNDSGMYQCILHLSTVPPVVSQGIGPTRYKARIDATKNSLQNIITLTKKSC